MMRKKVELLAPAGSMDAFEAALAAGADAVYLAGNRFGARAYATNFTQEELIDVLNRAHLFGVKIYLTVNTLIKENELSELYPFLLPLYENGLDGVIVQDIGAISLIKACFPEMEIHVSTQMTVTGSHGIALAKKMGAVRVVPAREMSLSEIESMKKMHPDMELECFVHGAMCYCYSGQCLFSSLVGGRSGNRGTCAQPCRLKYSITGKDGKKVSGYPLSLKDMMTLSMLDELIKAGIDSFKIEGRMKSPEYVAGVVSVYRKVIDRYYENPSAFTGPSKDEIKLLEGLYIRGGRMDGYYRRHNGKEMVSFSSPGYIGNSDAAIEYVKERYLNKDAKRRLPVQMRGEFCVGRPFYLEAISGDRSVSLRAEEVLEAINKPVTSDELIKRLSKTGDTDFVVDSIQIEVGEKAFLPVGSINEARRELLKRLGEAFRIKRINRSIAPIEKRYDLSIKKDRNTLPKKISVWVRNVSQLQSLLDSSYVHRLYVEDACMDSLRTLPKKSAKEIYYSFPRILREKDAARVYQAVKEYIINGFIDGLYVHTVDSFQLASLLAKEYELPIVASPFFYTWNHACFELFPEIYAYSVPFELNEREIHDVMRGLTRETIFEMPVYGKIPLMVSAGCVQKTIDSCLKGQGKNSLILRDEKGNAFEVLRNCEYCYNEILNTDPLNLLSSLTKIEKIPNITSYLFILSQEEPTKVDRILSAFCESTAYENDGRTTSGHFKRGVI